MRIVATYGVFDCFHEGHRNLLRRARELGDYLIVGVTTNRFDSARGKLDTIDSLEKRMEAVRNSGLADEVIVETDFEQKVRDIENRSIDVIVAGSDWVGKFDYLNDKCEVAYLPRTEGISSSELRKLIHPEIRLGVIGTGRIARRFYRECDCVGGVRIASVYNPHRASAQKFACEMDRDLVAFDDMAPFFDSVDAVYVASPNEFHYEQTEAALLAGKHVLCEKPFVLSKAQAERLFSLANEQDLVLLEAIKTAYCPGFEDLIDVARSGAIGEIRDIEAVFTRLTDPAVRERKDAVFGGSFLEFGSYCLLPAIRLLEPRHVAEMELQFYTQRDENGVDLFTKATLSDADCSVLAKTGLDVKAEGQLIISGTEGYILAPAPWWLTSRFEVHHEDPSDIQTYEVPFQGDGLRYEISNFVHLINGDEGRYPGLLPDESATIAGIFERYRADGSQS